MNPRTIAAGTALAAALATALSSTALASADAATSHHATRTDRAGSYVVSARVNKTEPLLDSKVKIKATVTPAAPGEAVKLQVKYEDQKRWKTIDHGRLSAASRVTFKDKVGSVRYRHYRVVKPAGAGHGAGQGTTPRVTVFGWRDLTSLSPATYSNMYEVNTATMNGVQYPSSVRSYTGYPPPGNTASIDYNLNRDCKAFKGTVGLDDSSPASATATIQLSADGVQRYSGAFALTQSAPVAFDVTRVFRLTIAATTTANGLAAVGTPQVLCSF